VGWWLADRGSFAFFVHGSAADAAIWISTLCILVVYEAISS
jgi:hypothetical protein